MADEQKPKASKKSKTPEAGETPQAKGDAAPKKAKAGGDAAGKAAESGEKASGDAAGKTAKPAKAEPYSGPPRQSMKIPRLQKKNNPHLPRKLKKAQKKAAAAQAQAPVTSTPTQL